MKTARFNIGTHYLPIGKHTVVCTVTDILTTYNSKGALVNIRYEASHEFCGQTVTETNIVETAIARGVWNLESKTLGKTPTK